jgi:3-oxoacyl-[acyl-carrier protein] reductase
VTGDRSRPVALVTGGARGIGSAIVTKLHYREVRVAYTSRQAAGAIIGASDDLLHVRYDLIDDDPDELVDRVLQAWGRLDMLILNAGVWVGGTVERLPEETWWRVVDTNVRGNYRVARAAVAALRESTAASIVLVSSAVGVIGFPGDTAYATAKSSLLGLCRSLAKELAPAKVRVNVVAPGFVETDMTAGVSDKARSMIMRRCLIERFGTAEEVADAVIFVAQDATYCTGSVLLVDGGWSI